MTKIINGAQLIYNYIIQLKNSSIYKTKFGNIISQFSEEIEYFLSQFPFLFSSFDSLNFSFGYEEKFFIFIVYSIPILLSLDFL